MPHAEREPRDPARLAGDETLVRQHLLRVWRYLRVQGARAHDADDLTQETFLVALRRDATRLEPAAAAAFLQHTARYLFLRRRRGDRASTELADAVDALWQRDCADGGDELLAALRECVARLEARTRRALELGYGLAATDTRSRAEIARELDMTENGVKTMLQRARQRLRDCIARRRP